MAAIKSVNGFLAVVASDRLLREHFSSVQAILDPSTVGERVVLLDALWGTRLFMESRAQDCIAASLASNAAMLTELFESLEDEALENTPERVIWVATEALPTVLCPPREGDKPLRKNFSFAAKFFHWTTGRHFPIVDKNTRKRINAIQRQHHVGGVHRVLSQADRKNLTGDYRRWICFYSDIIAGLSPSDREAILRADYDSQPRGLRIKNSLLRVLDKVFYKQGGGNGLSRSDT